MRFFRLLTLAATLSLSLLVSGAVAASSQEPTPAQVHIRHVVDAINGTPDRVGLLSILEAEAKIAAQHAKLAAADTESLESMQLHIRHVRHAVDPSAEPKGPGKGYGVSKAAKDVETHIILVPRIFNYYTKSGSPCVSSVRWAKRAIDSRIWSADLVHLNGFGSSLWASR